MAAQQNQIFLQLLLYLIVLQITCTGNDKCLLWEIKDMRIELEDSTQIFEGIEDNIMYM
mgnify:FL=1